MKSFSIKPSCEKCGYRDIARTFHDAEDLHCGGFGGRLYYEPVKQEHHAMYCRRCGFAWQERIKPKFKTAD